MGSSWKQGMDAHINLYELLALLRAIKWRARSCSNLGSRILHLVDSQVVASMCAKRRTASRKLQGTLRRLNSWLIAAHFWPLYAYVHSEDNPADIPSRWASREGKES